MNYIVLDSVCSIDSTHKLINYFASNGCILSAIKTFKYMSESFLLATKPTLATATKLTGKSLWNSTSYFSSLSLLIPLPDQINVTRKSALTLNDKVFKYFTRTD